MKSPRKLGFFHQFSLASQRILWFGPFAVFRVAPWDEGVRQADGGNWIGGFGRMTKASDVTEGRFRHEFSEAKALHGFPGCCRRH